MTWCLLALVQQDNAAVAHQVEQQTENLCVAGSSPARGTSLGKIMLRQFTIDESFICDVIVRTEHDFIKDRNNPTHEDLIKALKGWDKSVSVSNKDHDEFTKLRNQLEELGYIKTERSWWNGDRVLKSFKLNEWTFRKGEKFSCAGAMRVSIDCARKHGWKRISHL